MALIFCPPKGHKLEKKTIGLDGFAKAAGLRFPPWELVTGASDRQEQQIASYCADRGFPLVVMDWSNEKLVDAYADKHPGEMPNTPAAMARFLAKNTAKPDTGREMSQTAKEDEIPVSTTRHIPGHKAGPLASVKG